MVLNKDRFANAYSETYVILQNLNKNYIDMIPDDFMQCLKNNVNSEYEYTYNNEIEFEDNEMLRETKALLAYIFLNYWATEEQKNAIEAKFEADILKTEKEKYSYENLFKKREKNNTLELNNNEEKNIAVIEKKKSLFKKILIKIKRFLFK